MLESENSSMGPTVAVTVATSSSHCPLAYTCRYDLRSTSPNLLGFVRCHLQRLELSEQILNFEESLFKRLETVKYPFHF